MDKKELLRTIQEAEQRIEKERPKRAVKAALIFAAGYFFLLHIIFKPHGIEILEYILLAAICGVVHLFVSIPVFHWLHAKSQAEDNYIEKLKNQLNE